MLEGINVAVTGWAVYDYRRLGFIVALLMLRTGDLAS
jgi:hypothetical protein